MQRCVQSMKAVNRRCSNCRKKVASKDALVSHLKAFCDYSCLKEYTAKNAEKLATKARKETRKDDQKKKEKLKTKGQWTKEAQAAFNAYVRWRDRNKPCISCGQFTADNAIGGNWDAGHYRSTGSAPHLRFNLHNCHKQCVRCNRYLSGNVADYRTRLQRKIGVERLEKIELDDRSRNYTINDLKRIKQIFTRKKKIQERYCKTDASD
jgi:hypothetical protein